MRAQSRGLVTPGLGHSYLRISHVFLWEAKKYKFSGKDSGGSKSLTQLALVQAVLDVVICYV